MEIDKTTENENYSYYHYTRRPNKIFVNSVYVESKPKLKVRFPGRYVPPIDPSVTSSSSSSGGGGGRGRVGLVRPLDVAIGFDNFEILKIDDRDFTIEINAYLVVKWRDTRVHINFEQLYPFGWPPQQQQQDHQQQQVHQEPIPDWIPVELEVVSRLWLPDSEILRLKGFNSLSVLDKLQVSLTALTYVAALLSSFGFFSR